jgi:hypothetical protein
MLGPFVPLMIGTQLLMVAAAGGPPKVDIAATCRTSEREITKLFGSSTMMTYDGCMRQQNEAFEQIEKNWTTYPAGDRAHCVQARAYMPSYVEWLTCFEMQRDVRRMKAEEKK